MRTRAEQETVITRSADEAEWEVYSCDPAVIRKLDKRYQAYEEHEDSKRYRLPRKALSFRTPRKLAEGQREAMSERMKHLREAGRSQPDHVQDVEDS